MRRIGFFNMMMKKGFFFDTKAMSIDFFIKQRIEFAQCLIDETLPNFIKRKHSRKGEKRKQSARTRVQAGKRAPKKFGKQELIDLHIEAPRRGREKIV